MVQDTDRAWLAGLWDGEGSISLFSNQEKDGGLKIKPVCLVVNTDIGIINKALDILERADVSCYIVNQKRFKTHYKDLYQIKCTRMSEIEKLLNLIALFLAGEKKSKAEILLRFVRRRQLRLQDKGRNDLATYEDADWQDLNQIRSSETSRETLPLVNNVTMVKSKLISKE